MGSNNFQFIKRKSDRVVKGDVPLPDITEKGMSWDKLKSSLMRPYYGFGENKKENSLFKEDGFVAGITNKSGDVYAISYVPVFCPAARIEQVTKSLKEDNIEHVSWGVSKPKGVQFFMLPVTDQVTGDKIGPYITGVYEKLGLSDILPLLKAKGKNGNVLVGPDAAVRWPAILPDVFKPETPYPIKLAKGELISPEYVPTGVDSINRREKTDDEIKAIINAFSQGSWARIYSALGYSELSEAMEKEDKRVTSPITDAKNSVVRCKAKNAHDFGNFLDFSTQSPSGRNMFKGVEFLSEFYERDLKKLAYELADIVGADINLGDREETPEQKKARELATKERLELQKKEKIERAIQNNKDTFAERSKARNMASEIRCGVVADNAPIISYLTGRMGELGEALKGTVKGVPSVMQFAPNVRPSGFQVNGKQLSKNIPVIVTQISRYTKETGELVHVGDHYTALQKSGSDYVKNTDVSASKVRAKSFYMDKSSYTSEELNNPDLSFGSAAGGAAFLSSVDQINKHGEVHLTEGLENAAVILYGKRKPAIACVDANGLEGVILPPGAKRVTIHVDLDASSTGLKSAMVAKERFEREGREVNFRFPILDKSYPHIVPYVGDGKLSMQVADELALEGRNVKILCTGVSEMPTKESLVSDQKFVSEQSVPMALKSLISYAVRTHELNAIISDMESRNQSCEKFRSEFSEVENSFFKNLDYLSDKMAACDPAKLKVGFEPAVLDLAKPIFVQGTIPEAARLDLEEIFSGKSEDSNVPLKRLLLRSLQEDVENAADLKIAKVKDELVKSINPELSTLKNVVLTPSATVPYGHPELGFSVKTVEGKIRPVNKGIDLIDEIGVLSIKDIKLPRFEQSGPSPQVGI